MKRFRFNQQEIVFAVFALLFLVFSIFLNGFLTADNMLTLLQNVAVLGILGLAMAIVVIGRGIDISLIAALAVPPGLVLQMVQNGHSLPFSLVTAVLLTIAFGLVNGWLIAYAEVPSLFATLATGLLLAGLGQAALFQLDVVQWSAGMNGFERLRTEGRGSGYPSTSKCDDRYSSGWTCCCRWDAECRCAHGSASRTEYHAIRPHERDAESSE